MCPRIAFAIILIEDALPSYMKVIGLGPRIIRCCRKCGDRYGGIGHLGQTPLHEKRYGIIGAPFTLSRLCSQTSL
jgi:hypothetical protein